MNNEKLIKLPKQVEEMKSQMESIVNKTVLVQGFVGETIESKIEKAIEYAKQFIISQPESGGSYINSNAIVKVPKGRYIINKEITSFKGIEYDFSECTFVAKDNTINFMNAVGGIWRGKIKGGNFVGFNKVFSIATDNIDGAMITFESPTFSKCKIGIDTTSYEASRSTFLRINNITSLDCENTVIAHTDMCVIDGGWINHNGGDYASIVNKAYLKIKDVVFIPYGNLSTNSRWIDNYDSVDGGDRNLSLEHCRFGGEFGGLNYIVINNANNYYFDRVQTRLVIEDCMMYAQKNYILLNKLPNTISIKNCNGNGCISAINTSSTFNDNDIQAWQCTIDVSKCFRGANQSYQKLFGNSKLERLVVKEYFNSNRFNYSNDVVLNRPFPLSTDKTFFEFLLNIPAFTESDSGGAYSRAIGNWGFMVSLSGCVQGNGAYGTNSLNVISLVGGIFDGSLKLKANFKELYGTLGGSSANSNVKISDVVFVDSNGTEIGNTINPYLIKTDTKIRVKFNTAINYGGANLFPIFGNAIGNTFI